VDQAKTHKPDLILMDVRMPKMTGYEACEVLKDDPNTNGIPIVFLSAKGQETEIKQGMELGAEEYIIKPFAPDALYQRVTDILKRTGHHQMPPQPE
jgi:DNA-binding response OmpR family regulator